MKTGPLSVGIFQNLLNLGLSVFSIFRVLEGKYFVILWSCKKIAQNIFGWCLIQRSIPNCPLGVGIFQESLKLCCPGAKTCILRKSCKKIAQNIFGGCAIQSAMKTSPLRVGILQKSLKPGTFGIFHF